METVQKRLLSALALALLLCGNSAAEHSFVILIAPSPRMDSAREATMRTVADLVRTGFHGNAQEGDNVSIRIGSSSNALMSFAWSGEKSNDLSAQAATAVGAFPYRATHDSGPVDLAQPGDEASMVCVLLDGFRELRGTPFDHDLNYRVRVYRSQFAEARKPLLVALTGQGNEWVAWSPHTTLGAPVLLPRMPTAQIAKLEPPTKIEEPKPVAPVIVEPLQEPQPQPLIVETKPEPIPEKIEPLPDPVPPTLEPTPPQAEPVAQVAAAPIVQKEEPKPEPAPVAPAVVAVATPPRPPFPWLALTIALTGVAAAGLAAYRRLTKPAPTANSLISRSIDGQQPRRPSKLVAERKDD